MNMLDCYVMFSAILFIIGVYCLTTKRNMIRMILGIEILINAANLNFIVFSAFRAAGFIDPLGHSIVMVSVGLAGCVTAVALAITIHAYKHYGTIDIRRLSRLRG